MKTAYWIERTHLFRADEYICAACQTSADKPYLICPACKAQMKKVREGSSWIDEAEGMSALFDDDP